MRYKVLITIGIWMKKIEPNDKVYPVWVLFIALVFTGFSLYDWLG